MGFPLDLTAFPLIGNVTLERVQEVLLIDLERFHEYPLEDLLSFNIPSIPRYTNVDIVVEGGPVLLGVQNGSLNLDQQFPYAISTILQFPITEDTTTPSMIVLTPNSLKTILSNELSVLAQIDENASIILQTPTGDPLWANGTRNNVLLINDQNLTLHQTGSINLFPISPLDSETLIELSVTPSDSTVDITALINSISEVFSGSEEPSEFSNQLQAFEPLITAASAIVNGGMVLVETEDTIEIDGSSQTFAQFGFARGDYFLATYDPTTEETMIEGEYKLIFLGDHLYTAQAKNSDNGVIFPYLFIVIWIFAICLFVLVHFYWKREIFKEIDKKYKWPLIVFHIAALIITFILLDREISFQFGMSAFDALMGEGVSLVFAGFILVELLMWVLGYLLLAFPLSLLIVSCMQYFGYGKSWKPIVKGVSGFFIWVFAALYVTLFINIVFLFLNPSNLFPMG
jgi:hypothetical protein